MARAIHTYWVNPYSDSHILPRDPNDVIQAAIAYWEDQLHEYRAKRPRKPEDRERKEHVVQKATERLTRYRHEREVRALRPREASAMTLTLATDDLRKVMKP